MLVHCNETLSVLHKHTQYPTLITEKERGYSSRPQQEQRKEGGICEFLHPLMTYNLLGRWVFCLGALIDMSNITMSREEIWGWNGAHGWTVILQLSGHSVGHVATDQLCVKQLSGGWGFRTSQLVWRVICCTYRSIIFMLLDLKQSVEFLSLENYAFINKL